MDAGQRLRTGRLWGGIHPPLVVAVAPFCCVDDAEIDEFVDACDDSDVDELERGAVLRGISILDTSSALMLVIPLEAPLPALQELRRLDWKFGGGATAVMWSEGEVGSLWTAEVEASRRQNRLALSAEKQQGRAQRSNNTTNAATTAKAHADAALSCKFEGELPSQWRVHSGRRMRQRLVCWMVRVRRVCRPKEA